MEYEKKAREVHPEASAFRPIQVGCWGRKETVGWTFEVPADYSRSIFPRYGAVSREGEVTESLERARRGAEKAMLAYLEVVRTSQREAPDVR